MISLVVGALGLLAFLWRQVVLQRKDDALLDLRVFTSRDFTLSMLQMFLLSLAFFGTITVIPLFLQKALGLESTEAGLVVLPGALAMGLLGPRHRSHLRRPRHQDPAHPPDPSSPPRRCGSTRRSPPPRRPSGSC